MFANYLENFWMIVFFFKWNSFGIFQRWHEHFDVVFMYVLGF